MASVKEAQRVTEGRSGVVATAAMAAAAGAAVYGVRKALASGGDQSRSGEEEDRHGGDDQRDGQGGSILATVWQSASQSLLPIADDAAGAAGKWVAEKAPEPLRQRIIPRFIEAFQNAA